MELLENLKKKQDELTEKIYQLVGEASMCWDILPSGIFKEETARRISEDILNIIDQFRSETAELVEREEERKTRSMLEKLLIKCECDHGNCPNCKRVCTVLDWNKLNSLKE